MGPSDALDRRSHYEVFGNRRECHSLGFPRSKIREAKRKVGENGFGNGSSYAGLRSSIRHKSGSDYYQMSAYMVGAEPGQETNDSRLDHDSAV